MPFQIGSIKMTMGSVYFSGLQAPDFNPTEQLWDVVEQLIYVQPTNKNGMMFLG